MKKAKKPRRKKAATGLVPIEGQPGVFRDATTGKLVDVSPLSEDWTRNNLGHNVLRLKRGLELRVVNDYWQLVRVSTRSDGYGRVVALEVVAQVRLRGRVADRKREAEAFARLRGLL